MIRLLCGAALCFGAYLLGQTYVSYVRERIRTVEDYLALTRRLISTVRFSSADLRQGAHTCLCGGAARFAKALADSQDLTRISYTPRGREEAECVRLLKNAIAASSESSDAREVVGALVRAEEDMTKLKEQTEEAYRGKLMAAPRAALVIGLFLAVLFV